MMHQNNDTKEFANRPSVAERKFENKIYVLSPPRPQPKFRDLLAYLSEDEVKNFMSGIRDPINLSLDSLVDQSIEAASLDGLEIVGYPSVLVYAIARKLEEIALALIKIGANVNIMGLGIDETPLSYAFAYDYKRSGDELEPNSNIKVTTALINAGADIFAFDHNGKTLFHIWGLKKNFILDLLNYDPYFKALSAKHKNSVVEFIALAAKKKISFKTRVIEEGDLELSAQLCKQMAAIYCATVNKERNIYETLNEKGVQVYSQKQQPLANNILSFLFPRPIVYPQSLKRLEKFVRLEQYKAEQVAKRKQQEAERQQANEDESQARCSS